LLYWNHRSGFESENSEDEGTSYRREIRRY